MTKSKRNFFNKRELKIINWLHEKIKEEERARPRRQTALTRQGTSCSARHAARVRRKWLDTILRTGRTDLGAQYASRQWGEKIHT